MVLHPSDASQIDVRAGAAELLGACLAIVALRDRSAANPLLDKLLKEAQNGLLSGAVETVHGSLLTLRELLMQAGMVRTSGTVVYSLIPFSSCTTAFLL